MRAPMATPTANPRPRVTVHARPYVMRCPSGVTFALTSEETDRVIGRSVIVTATRHAVTLAGDDRPSARYVIRAATLGGGDAFTVAPR